MSAINSRLNVACVASTTPAPAPYFLFWSQPRHWPPHITLNGFVVATARAPFAGLVSRWTVSICCRYCSAACAPQRSSPGSEFVVSFSSESVVALRLHDSSVHWTPRTAPPPIRIHRSHLTGIGTNQWESNMYTTWDCKRAWVRCMILNLGHWYILTLEQSIFTVSC
jgi:hypothetical protein